MQVSGESEAVAAVVAWATTYPDARVVLGLEQIEHTIPEPDRGVLHEQDRRDSIAFQGEMIERFRLLGTELKQHGFILPAAPGGRSLCSEAVRIVLRFTHEKS